MERRRRRSTESSRPLKSISNRESEYRRSSPFRRARHWLRALLIVSVTFALLWSLSISFLLQRKSTLWGLSLELEAPSYCQRQHHGIPLHPPPLPSNRSDRFPSVDERVRMYMSDWYVPPCENYTDGFVYFSKAEKNSVRFYGEYMRQQSVFSAVRIEQFFAAYPKDFEDCVKKQVFKQYCKDIANSLVPASRRIEWNKDIPFFMHIGDRIQPSNTRYIPNVPYLKKYRYAITRQRLDEKTKSVECHASPRPVDNLRLEPIIWKLNVKRHYGQLKEISKCDIPWEKKKPRAVFRGKFTGYPENFGNSLALCLTMPRCRLVYSHSNSKLVDAKLTGFMYRTKRVDAVIRNVSICGETLSIEEQLQFKALILVEGYDVATGLKWAMLSNSVVLMAPPTKASYAMEDMLEPWVHYVPLNGDFSDVESKMRWVIDNDAYAQRISQRATLWIEDLVLHRDAKADHLQVEEEILMRYQKHFRRQEGATIPPSAVGYLALTPDLP